MDPEYKSQRGAVTISTASSLHGVMQNSRVFCDFNLSSKSGAIDDIQDILLELSITNNDITNYLYLTSTYLMYDLIQIIIGDDTVEEIRSDNSFIDHTLYNSDILANYSELEGYSFSDFYKGSIVDPLLTIPSPSALIPFTVVAPKSTSKFYIVLPSTCISNKNIPLQFINNNIKLRIYFKTSDLVLSTYDAKATYVAANFSNNFEISSINAILLGNKYDENTLQLLKQKYIGKKTLIPTNVHCWKTVNIGQPGIENLEVKIPLTGKMNDITFFVRSRNTKGVLGAQFYYDVTTTLTPHLYTPLSWLAIDSLTLKDSQGDYANYYSNIDDKVLRLIHNKYGKCNSLWNNIFAIYNFNFSDNLVESIKSGNDYGNCLLDGAFNLVFNMKNLLPTTFSSVIPAQNLDLIITSHQQKYLVLDENGKLSMPKGQ